MYFSYGERETEYLRRKDKRLGAVIERVGYIERAVDPDLFSAVVHHIVGQQVSMRAQATVWARLRAALGEVSAQTVAALDAEALRGMGMSLRKAEYILDFARRVQSGEFDLEAVRRMDDGQAIAALTSLRGVGVWTAEMILLFCLQRPDVLSYDDLAIRRGLRMLYRHKGARPRALRALPPPLFALWQRGQPLPLGGRLRRDRGIDRPRRARDRNRIAARDVKIDRPRRAARVIKTAFEP